MADTQNSPAPLPGSEREAAEAFLGLLDPQEETIEEPQESAPTEDVDESTEETQDEPLEEEQGELEDESEDEEEEEPELEEEEEETEEVYSVKVDGEEMDVSLDELIKGYSRQSDYTRKTQDLASERGELAKLREEWANEISQAQAERQQYIDNIGQIVANSVTALDSFQNVNWERLRETDPIAFVTKREEYREAQEKISQLQQQQKEAQAKQDAEFQRVKQAAVQEEYNKLVERVPEWADGNKRSKIATDLSSYAIDQGFTKHELAELIDHRSLIVLMKAQKYDELQNSDIKSKKVKNKPKVIRSGRGAKPQKDVEKSKRVASMKRLKETGSANDAVALFEDYVDI
jgi:hypothetical protein